MISRQMISRLLASLFGTLMVLSASAQGFPNKMVTVMVPYPAGGPSDAVGRLVQVEYEKNLGQKMVLENLGGVSGALGLQKVLAAPADGQVPAGMSVAELDKFYTQEVVRYRALFKAANVEPQ